MKVYLLDSFDDPRLPREEWNRLARTVFQTWEWQKAWWQTFGRGDLLLAVAEQEGRVVAVAPMFLDGGMVFFTGSGGSDYLDFLGDVDGEGVMEALLEAALGAAPELLGFRFYHVVDSSSAGERLRAAASRLGLVCHDEGEMAAPYLNVPSCGEQAANKGSLVRHERRLAREGRLEVIHCTDSGQVIPWLDAFFEQHERRWSGTEFPSLFVDPAQRQFYRRVAQLGGEAGWLRFARVMWNGQAAAFHFGFHYRGEFLWYKPSFEVALAKRSPGEVLLRDLILRAIEEGAEVFDFGLGEEGFKRRFATGSRVVRTWGLYP